MTFQHWESPKNGFSIEKFNWVKHIRPDLIGIALEEVLSEASYQLLFYMFDVDDARRLASALGYHLEHDDRREEGDNYRYGHRGYWRSYEDAVWQMVDYLSQEVALSIILEKATELDLPVKGGAK